MAASRRWRLAWQGGCRLLHTEPSVAPQPPSSLYPPVVASHTAKSKSAKRRRLEYFYQRVHEAPSIEEKLRIYGCLQRLKYVVYPQTFSLNADRWYQSFTKTVFVPGLPPAGAEPAGPDLSELRSLACDALLQEHFYQHKRKRSLPYQEQEHIPAPFLTQLVSSLTAALGSHNPLLRVSCLDLKPQVNFYWERGETVVTRGYRTGRIDPVRFQIDDKPHVQLRVPKQLPEFVPLDYSVPGEVPVVNHTPDKLPMFKRQYDNKVFIGSKVADPCSYGHTQFHLIPDKLKRERLLKADLADQIEVVHRANGIASLFAWTAAQAMYQGFWCEADVTRPFVSQAVITDGKYFAFFCYQLNTLALTVKADQNNSRKNICWGTESKPLYEAVEGSNVKGFNDEILFQIVQFLLNRPEQL
ncbi:large ribosomal subunit protein mL65 [Carettochelys insculpta]|uniref:large ribosomal subunit protein mL65 n=1 Tax=Carettochelys insculpta TaxID=44489 RepID=UPI003EC0C3FD